MEHSDTDNFDEEGGPWPDALITELQTSEPTKRLQIAKNLAEGAIHLHDGKDYVDDALPKLEAVLGDVTVPCLERCYVALCIARLLAHSWDWNPENFAKIVALSSVVLHDPSSPNETKSVAVEVLVQIFDPDNDSDTEQEDKSVGKIIKLLGKHFVPQQRPAGDGGANKKQKQTDADVVTYIVSRLSELLNSDCAELVENVSSLLSHMPQPKKRSRGDGPSPMSQLVDKLEQLVAAGGGGVAPQVAGILKGMLKTTTDAAFEVVNDLCGEDIEYLPTVQPYLLRLYAAVPRALDIPGKDGVTFDDELHSNEEKCPNKHFGLAAAVLATLYAIRSGASADANNPPPPPIDPAEMKKFLLAWRAHRYHVGNEFEMIERCAWFVAKQNEATWKSCDVVMEMPWTCISDPFGPQQPGGTGRGGFVF